MRSRTIGNFGYTLNRIGNVAQTGLRRFASSPAPALIKGAATGLGLLLDGPTGGISGEVAQGVNMGINALTSKAAQGIAGGVAAVGSGLEKFS